MSRRNHSRRAHAPYDGGYPGIGYAEDAGDRPGTVGGSGDEGRNPMGRWGGVGQLVSDRPHVSLVTAFGVGFGLGLLVTLLLDREEESWFDRHAPDSIRDLPGRFDHARHRLTDRLSSSWDQARDKLADTVTGPLGRAGEAVASHVPRSWKLW